MAKGLLDGKVVVVTGAGRGIGAEFAKMMASEGAAVVVNDLGGTVDGEGADLTPAQQVVQEITDAGGAAVANGDSVADWDGAHNIIATAIKSFGKIDGVVNNAGILRDRIFHKMTQEDFHAVINVHLVGAFNVSKAAADHFKNQKSGAFVHMTSTSGLVGNLGQANYAAAKLGIAGLSKSIALDMERYNVRSNCISPFAWSRMIGTIPSNSPEQEARLAKLQTMTPKKIAPVATFLLSDAASAVNGQIIAVRSNEIFLMSQSRPIRSMHKDGGWTPSDVAARLVPTFKSAMYPLELSADVFSWDPI